MATPDTDRSLDLILARLPANQRDDLDWIVLKALAKNPRERYVSVAEMTADLENFLAHRPVYARAPSLAYRVRKWGTRHPLSSLLAAALALVLIFGTVAMVMQRSRNQRLTAFSQEVERESERMEQVLRDASLQPLHDTTPERKRVYKRIAHLEREAAKSPVLLGAAADYGAGRGLLALGEYELASTRLHQAWDGGFRGNGVRYALGAALGRLYRIELKKAREIDDEKERASRVRAAEDRYRDKALAHLGAIRSAADVRAALIPATMAFYEGESDQALEILRGIRQSFPWAHETYALESEILGARAETRIGAAEWELAKVDLEAARVETARGLEIARSDAALHLQECRLINFSIQTRLHDAETLESMVREAEAACGRSLKVRPRWIEPYLELGWMYLEYSNAAAGAESERYPFQAPMRAAAENALLIDPNNAEAHHRLGLALYIKANEKRILGEDSADVFRHAIRALTRACDLAPFSADSHSGLGLASFRLAELRMRDGRDASQEVEVAVRAISRAVEISPNWRVARSNLGYAHLVRGDWLRMSGADPTAIYQESSRHFAKARASNPQRARFTGLLETVFARLTLSYLEQGLEAEAFLAQLRTLESERPSSASSHGLALLAAATNSLVRAWASAEDPAALLETARQHLHDAEGIFDSYSPRAGYLRLESDLVALWHQLPHASELRPTPPLPVAVVDRLSESLERMTAAPKPQSRDQGC